MKTRTKLEQEYAKIQDELAQARAQLSHKESVIEKRESALEANKLVIESKDAFIDQLKEALILAHNRKFAKSTESLRSLQSELFNEVEQEVATGELPINDSDENERKI
jgi:hypothetical protein